MAVVSLGGPNCVGVVWSSGGCIVEEILALSVADRKRVAGGGGHSMRGAKCYVSVSCSVV